MGWLQKAVSEVWGESTWVWPSLSPERSLQAPPVRAGCSQKPSPRCTQSQRQTDAAPVWIPHLQNRLLWGKPLAPTICPIMCSSAILWKKQWHDLGIDANKIKLIFMSACLFGYWTATILNLPPWTVVLLQSLQKQTNHLKRTFLRKWRNV